MNKNTNIFYVNGFFVPENKATISVLDIGLLRGYGVFDFLVTYSGRPFLLDEHINRLFSSAEEISLKIGKSKTNIKKIILKTLYKNSRSGEKIIRIIITGGVGKNSYEPSKNPSIIVTVQPKHVYPKRHYSEGIKIITYGYERPIADAKSLDYSIAIKALGEARKKGAMEALYISKNKSATEATASNIFIVKKDKIFTPKNNVLNGITRSLLIRLCKSSTPVKEKNIKLREIFSADEVFVTASNKEIMPVVKIDNHKIGNGRVGPTTKSIMQLYRNFIESGKW